jgi:transcriptional regulator with XRE-family HTH domain
MDLREKREHKGMTQLGLAQLIGKDRSLITKIECKATKPSVDTAKKIAKVLGFDWTEFFKEDKNAR